MNDQVTTIDDLLTRCGTRMKQLAMQVFVGRAAADFLQWRLRYNGTLSLNDDIEFCELTSLHDQSRVRIAMKKLDLTELPFKSKAVKSLFLSYISGNRFFLKDDFAHQLSAHSNERLFVSEITAVRPIIETMCQALLVGDDDYRLYCLDDKAPVFCTGPAELGVKGFLRVEPPIVNIAKGMLQLPLKTRMADVIAPAKTQLLLNAANDPRIFPGVKNNQLRYQLQAALRQFAPEHLRKQEVILSELDVLALFEPSQKMIERYRAGKEQFAVALTRDVGYALQYLRKVMKKTDQEVVSLVTESLSMKTALGDFQDLFRLLLETEVDVNIFLQSSTAKDDIEEPTGADSDVENESVKPTIIGQVDSDLFDVAPKSSDVPDGLSAKPYRGDQDIFDSSRFESVHTQPIAADTGAIIQPVVVEAVSADGTIQPVVVESAPSTDTVPSITPVQTDKAVITNASAPAAVPETPALTPTIQSEVKVQPNPVADEKAKRIEWLYKKFRGSDIPLDTASLTTALFTRLGRLNYSETDNKVRDTLVSATKEALQKSSYHISVSENEINEEAMMGNTAALLMPAINYKSVTDHMSYDKDLASYVALLKGELRCLSNRVIIIQPVCCTSASDADNIDSHSNHRLASGAFLIRTSFGLFKDKTVQLWRPATVAGGIVSVQTEYEKRLRIARLIQQGHELNSQRASLCEDILIGALGEIWPKILRKMAKLSVRSGSTVKTPVASAPAGQTQQAINQLASVAKAANVVSETAAKSQVANASAAASAILASSSTSSTPKEPVATAEMKETAQATEQAIEKAEKEFNLTAAKASADQSPANDTKSDDVPDLVFKLPTSPAAVEAIRKHMQITPTKIVAAPTAVAADFPATPSATSTTVYVPRTEEKNVTGDASMVLDGTVGIKPRTVAEMYAELLREMDPELGMITPVKSTSTGDLSGSSGISAITPVVAPSPQTPATITRALDSTNRLATVTEVAEDDTNHGADVTFVPATPALVGETRNEPMAVTNAVTITPVTPAQSTPESSGTATITRVSAPTNTSSMPLAFDTPKSTTGRPEVTPPAIDKRPVVATITPVEAGTPRPKDSSVPGSVAIDIPAVEPAAATVTPNKQESKSPSFLASLGSWFSPSSSKTTNQTQSSVVPAAASTDQQPKPMSLAESRTRRNNAGNNAPKLSVSTEEQDRELWAKFEKEKKKKNPEKKKE